MPLMLVIEHVPQVIISAPLFASAQPIKDVMLSGLPPSVMARRPIFSWWGVSISTSFLMPSTSIPPAKIGLIVVMAIPKLRPTMARPAGHAVSSSGWHLSSIRGRPALVGGSLCISMPWGPLTAEPDSLFLLLVEGRCPLLGGFGSSSPGHLGLRGGCPALFCLWLWGLPQPA